MSAVQTASCGGMHRTGFTSSAHCLVLLDLIVLLKPSRELKYTSKIACTWCLGENGELLECF